MMDKNEKLTLSYSTLSDMLDEAQHDGLLADGCCYSLDYDIDEEIKRNIESGDIQFVKCGMWIVKKGSRGWIYGECSNCNMKNYAGETNYCPNCGARMKSEDK